MAEYRHKSPEELGWNQVRRAITYEVRRKAADVVEEILNTVLTQASRDYKAALESGRKLELEERYGSFVGDILRDSLPQTIEQP